MTPDDTSKSSLSVDRDKTPDPEQQRDAAIEQKAEGDMSSDKSDAQTSPITEDSRPGAKAGLTVTQFWLALAG